MRKPFVGSKKGVTMHPKMSQITREEVLLRKRDRYHRAGKEHKTKIICVGKTKRGKGTKIDWR